MARVTVHLPALLRPVADVPASVRVEAASLDGALLALVAAHPALRVHLFDERGGLREHVLCLHNGRSSRWSPPGAAVADGDVIEILQAVSGG